MLRFAIVTLGALVLLAVAVVALAPPRDRSVGRIEGPARAPQRVAEAQRAQQLAAERLAARSADPAGSDAQTQILFGDLHVHSTFSIDAFVFSLPLFGGEGAHPPADACDFARHCAAVDFFSINDHAEGLTPERWEETKESIRACNERAGDPANPDLVAFTGWEWTQVGATPETHFGHRNVIFPGLADGELPARPITSLPPGITNRARAMGVVRVLEKLGPLGLGEYADFLWLTRQIAELPDCAPAVDTRSLPPDCRESADTPAELFAKLDQWGFEHLVIPHGLGWGIHAPPAATLEASLRGGNHDPNSERLLEVMSGHGNSEQYRSAAEPPVDAAGERVCAEPTADFLPCCWQAGEIARQRCGDVSEAECERRVADAQRVALAAGTAPHLVFPDSVPEDWLDCDQCRDCFKPAMTLRPRETAQYGLALRVDDAQGQAQRFRWGFIASTDNHASRPATGYKQYARPLMTDARGIATPLAERLLEPFIKGRAEDPALPQAVTREPRSFAGLLDVEREASFMYPGGIVGVHATGRDRRAIWDALMRREVYGTSGPRILLWFRWLGADGALSMGSEVITSETPRFEVRAVGAFVQQPGCPESSTRALSAERLERLCRGECYNPGDARHPIEAIEIVRVRSQQAPGEPVEPLIDDPWRHFDCAPDPAGCVVRFEDPDYAAEGRSTAYYARAIQAATPAINAANLRTDFDASGNAVRTRPCHGGYRTPADDDCLAPAGERAWSSPIYLDPPAAP